MKHIAQTVLSAVMLVAASAAAAQDEPLATIPVDGQDGGAAPASKLPYTWAAGRLRRTEFEDTAFNAFGVEGAYLLQDNFFGIAALFIGESDDTKGPAVESTQFELGGGYRGALEPNLDLTASLRILHLDTQSDQRAEEELGLRADLVLRRMLMDRLEGDGGVSYVQIADSDDRSVEGSLLYMASPTLAIGAEGSYGSNSYSYGLLGRWAF
jgi:hypothetical protein